MGGGGGGVAVVGVVVVVVELLPALFMHSQWCTAGDRSTMSPPANGELLLDSCICSELCKPMINPTHVAHHHACKHAKAQHVFVFAFVDVRVGWRRGSGGGNTDNIRAAAAAAAAAAWPSTTTRWSNK